MVLRWLRGRPELPAGLFHIFVGLGSPPSAGSSAGASSRRWLPLQPSGAQRLQTQARPPVKLTQPRRSHFR
eukprot:5567677-Alexandrium_andersonii.AAC.1